MSTPFEFTSKGQHYKRDAENVLYARGRGQKQQCLLVFKNGEELIYPARLNIFQKLLIGKNYRRVGKSHFVYYPAFLDIRYRVGILYNGKHIPLYEKEYRELKKHLAEKKNRFLFPPFSANFPSVNPN